MLLKALLNTLRGGFKMSSNNLITQGLDFLIEGVAVHAIYSMKFEINRNAFKEYIKEFINSFDFNDDLKNEFIEVCYNWYVYYLHNKTLVGATSSLKSDLKKIYKKYDKELRGFDRFKEKIEHAFIEAYNVYTIVLYEPDAIKYNKNFIHDRKSCYITSRRDYQTVISQMNSYYTIIYKNNEPVTRVWFLCDPDYKSVAIFNEYGHKFKRLDKFFADGELEEASPSNLEASIGVYVNDSLVLMSKEASYDVFIYDNIECPSCGALVRSDEFEFYDGGVHCHYCRACVYSEYYGCYISEEEAYYSSVHESYIYYDDSVYSYFYDDRIVDSQAYKVYNIDIDDYDYVLRDDAIYSDYYEEWLIKDQCVYSDYYDSYLLRDGVNTVYSKYLNDFLDKRDENVIDIGWDYIPLKYLNRFIKVKGKYYQKIQQAYIIRLKCDLKPLKGVKLLKASF